MLSDGQSLRFGCVVALCRNFIRGIKVRGQSQAMTDLRAIGHLTNAHDIKAERDASIVVATNNTILPSSSSLQERQRALEALAPVRKIVEVSWQPPSWLLPLLLLSNEI
jgi:hypothetical protein